MGARWRFVQQEARRPRRRRAVRRAHRCSELGVRDGHHSRRTHHERALVVHARVDVVAGRRSARSHRTDDATGAFPDGVIGQTPTLDAKCDGYVGVTRYRLGPDHAPYVDQAKTRQCSLACELHVLRSSNRGHVACLGDVCPTGRIVSRPTSTGVDHLRRRPRAPAPGSDSRGMAFGIGHAAWRIVPKCPTGVADRVLAGGARLRASRSRAPARFRPRGDERPSRSLARPASSLAEGAGVRNPPVPSPPRPSSDGTARRPSSQRR